MLRVMILSWIVLAVLVVIGWTQYRAWQQRKEWNAAVDAALRRVGEHYRRQRRREIDRRVLDAIRERIRARQEAAWRN